MVGGRRLALADYAGRRDNLTPGRKLLFAARHPILEIAYRVAGQELVRAKAENGSLAESLAKQTRKLETTESMRRDAGRALAHLVHDINNPLTAITATVDLLKMEAEASPMPPASKAEVVDALNLVKDGCHRILHVTNTAMELSSADTGNMPGVELRFDAIMESDRVVRHMCVLAKKKGLHLIFEGNVPVEILSDHRLFDRVLSNIIGNALKYTEQGSITVSVARENGNATIKVKDTGPGMGTEDVRAIFEEHYRGKSSSGTSGKGLGLYIAKTYTERMGGKIGVESEPGKGTVFTLTFHAAEG